MKKILLLHNDNKDEELFVFPLNDKKALEKLDWEGNDEFKLNGEMYDVVEKRVENNNIIIRCISDKKETRLVKDYEKTNKDDFGNLPCSHKSSQLLKLVCSLYVNPFSNNSFYYNKPLIKHRPVYYRIIPSISPDILIPPPKSA
jgi:hypothetical protein